MKIGIYGGSFNPPHYGHFLFAESCIKNKLVDLVIFVPTGDDYQKASLAPAIDRLQMVKKMVSGVASMEVSDYEVRNGKKYTYETLEHFQKKYPGDSFFLLMGSDNLKEFFTWKKPDWIFKHATLLVSNRDGMDGSAYTKEYPFLPIQFVSFSLPPISSTMIRKKMKSQESCVSFLSPSVLLYIKEHGLYQ